MKTKTPKATLKFNAWELLAIEEALRNGLTCADKKSVEALIKKIANAKLKPTPTKVVNNLMSGKPVTIPVDTPLCCDPSSETYWSM